MKTFTDYVIKTTGCNKASAERVLDYFRKHKLIKIDVHGHGFTVKHGALLDKASLREALRIVQIYV